VTPVFPYRRLILPGAIVLLAVAVRLAWVYAVDPPAGLLDDAGYYHFFARALADGFGYVREDGVPTAFWPVGYPAALSLVYEIFGPSLTAAKLFNVVLGGASAAAVYALARVWFPRGESTAAALIYALWPGAIAYASVTMSETLFTFTFLVALLLLAKAGKPHPLDPPLRVRRGGGEAGGEVSPLARGHNVMAAVGFGIAVSIANYVRGQALLLPLIAVPWLLRCGWRWKATLVYAAAALVVVAVLSAPWLVRNTDRFGTLTFLSTNTGVNFWLGHREGADGGPDYQAQLTFAQRFDSLPRIEQEPAWSREGLREGLDYALGHPLDEVRLSLLKVYQLYRSDADALLWNEQNGATSIFSDGMRQLLRLVMDGYYYIVALLAVAGLYIGLRRRADWAYFFGPTIGYWTLVHIVFYGEPRLHVPLQPVLAILAAVAVASLRPKRRQPPRPTLAT
jgi:4-amino-4-deoxy-L-arabinose transferase-like glycosyltransferase